MPIIILFFILPLIELAIFGMVSEHVGVWGALLFALLTAIIGGSLVKQQGLQTMASMRVSMDAGNMPLDELFDGFCLMIAGALLITPGFLTDAIGFALLIPKAREFMRHIVRTRTNWTAGGSVGGFANPQGNGRNDGDIIEGEYETIKESNEDAGKDSNQIPKP